MDNKIQKENSLRRNVFSGMFFAVGNILILLVSYPIYLKYLGMERYGLWAILSVVISFSAFARLGIDTAVIKYVAEEYGRGNKLGIEKYFSTAIISLLIPGVLICFALVLLKGFVIQLLNIPEKYISITNTLFPYIVILSGSIFFVKVIDGSLRGLGRIDLANYYNLGGKVASVITAIILLKFGYGIWSLFWGQVLLYIFLGFLAFFTIYRKLGGFFFSIYFFDLKCLKKIAGFGGTMTGARLVSMFLEPFNKVIIGKYINLSSVTYFEIANRAIRQFRSIFEMGVRAIMPEISKLSVVIKGAKGKIHDVLKKAMRLICYLGIPVFIVLFFTAPFLLRLWLSIQYTPEITNAFKIILVGHVANLLVIPIYYLFMGIGKVSYCFINHFVQSILNIILVFLFIILGTATFYLFVGVYSLSITLSAMLLIMLFFKYKKIALREKL